MSVAVLKSVNLQYNTPVCLDDGTNESSTKRLMFQVLFFFIKSCKILCKDPFNLFSYFFYKITKMKIKSFKYPKSIRNYEKKILGTSAALFTSCLSHRPGESAYYISNCRIATGTWNFFSFVPFICFIWRSLKRGPGWHNMGTYLKNINPNFVFFFRGKWIFFTQTIYWSIFNDKNTFWMFKNVWFNNFVQSAILFGHKNMKPYEK